ncbi:MAG TPA: diphthine--ammonia ligase [Holophagaceae bacterium]|nr:diphthine--ammonia ligase [Holophagaceae bacterium]
MKNTLIPGTPFVCSWSGGKDSALAFHRAVQAGLRPVALLTMFKEDGARSRSHGLRPEVLAAQAEALGLPLIQGHATWDGYEREFIGKLREARTLGAEVAVFGDIDLQPHRDWEEKVCAEAGLTPHLPLWLEPRRKLVDELLGAGFQARLVAVRAGRLPMEFLGRTLDPALVDAIEAHGCDACGEEGEYHSAVVAGPGFASPLELVPGDITKVQDVWGLDFQLRLEALPAR